MVQNGTNSSGSGTWYGIINTDYVSIIGKGIYMKNLVDQSFIYGFIFAIMFVSMTMDMMGHEQYIEYISKPENWMDIAWGIWLIPMVAIAIIVHRMRKGTI